MLTKIELKENLNTLRSKLSKFDPLTIHNIVFFNMDSFYSFFKDISGECILDIINKIQPFIPIPASKENLELFLEANISEDIAEIKELEERFINKATIDFISTVQNIDNGEDWAEIVSVCESIRDYKEKSYAY